MAMYTQPQSHLESVAGAVSALRGRLGLTRETFAAQLDTALMTITALEQGRWRANRQTLHRMRSICVMRQWRDLAEQFDTLLTNQNPNDRRRGAYAPVRNPSNVHGREEALFLVRQELRRRIRDVKENRSRFDSLQDRMSVSDAVIRELERMDAALDTLPMLTEQKAAAAH